MPAADNSSRSPSSPDSRPSPTIWALGWTSFLTDLSSEAIYPLLPGFLRSLGGSSIEIGLVDGLANAVSALVRLPAGSLSDTWGRRRLVLLGYGFSAAVRPLMGVAGSPFQVLLVRAADRLGKGIRTAPRDALVADLVEPRHRGRAFGLIRSLDHAGAAIGPLLATLFLLAFPGRERLLFLLTLLPGLATLTVIWRFVIDPPGRLRVPANTLRADSLSTPQRWLLAAVAIWALGAASEQFLLLRIADLGTPPAAMPAVWFAISLIKSLTAACGGRLADHASPRWTLASGWLIFAAAYAGLACAAGLAMSLFLCGVVGLAYGLAEPAERKLVAALAAADRQGGGFGWYALVQGVMALPAGLVAGSLWDWGPHGWSWAFGATAGLSTAACGLLMLPAVRPSTAR